MAGKTFTAFQLLGQVAHPQMPATVLVAKPADAEVDRWKTRLGYQETDTWPPRRKLLQPRPPGYVVWPRHSFTDAEADEKHMHDVFQRAITHNYGHPPAITFCDELFRLNQIGLGKNVDAVLTGGSGMHSALWFATQKPSGTQRVAISSFAYNSPTWLFLAYDPDERNRKRYGEIGGVDPRLIEYTTRNLQKHEFFIFHRDSGGVCTIGA
jgi:hypothetical protein